MIEQNTIINLTGESTTTNNNNNNAKEQTDTNHLGSETMETTIPTNINQETNKPMNSTEKQGDDQTTPPTGKTVATVNTNDNESVASSLAPEVEPPIKLFLSKPLYKKAKKKNHHHTI